MSVLDHLVGSLTQTLISVQEQRHQFPELTEDTLQRILEEEERGTVWDTAFRRLVEPEVHALQQYPELSRYGMGGLSTADAPFFILSKVILLLAKKALGSFSIGPPDEISHRTWLGRHYMGRETIRRSLEEDCNNMEILSLLKRPRGKGCFLIDLSSIINSHERYSPKLDGNSCRLHLRLRGTGGFHLVKVEGSLSHAQIQSVLLEYMNIVSHAMVCHGMVGVGVVSASQTHLPTGTTIRKALQPTELRVRNSLGRAIVSLFPVDGKFTMNKPSGLTYGGLESMLRDASGKGREFVRQWCSREFAPHLHLTPHERNCQPFLALGQWHEATRAFATHVLRASDTPSDHVLRTWVNSAGFRGCKAKDVLTSSYLNLTFHNMCSNEDTPIVSTQDYTSSWAEATAASVVILPWPRLVPTLQGLDPAIFGDYVASLCAIRVDTNSHPQLSPHLVEVSVGF